jgi:sensor histidine kinase YesM
MIIIKKLVYSDRFIFRLLRHSLLVAFIIVFFSWIVSFRGQASITFSSAVLAVTLNAFFFLTYAYLTAYLLVPKLLMNRRFFLFFVLFLAGGVLLTSLKYIFSDYLFYDAITAGSVNVHEKLDVAYILVNTKDMTFIVSVFIIVKYAKDNRFKQQRLRELSDQQFQAEIRILRNQLDPHVMFNNLNNLYSLSLNNFSALPVNLSRFRRILEYYFKKGDVPKVFVEEELSLIDDFIGLEKLRYASRLKIDYSKKGVFTEMQIVPFILFSIVENCFEHGCTDNSGIMWIRIAVQSEIDGITFHASNSLPEYYFAGSADDSGMPVNISRLLKVFYPDKHSIRVNERYQRYAVDLKLKL